MLLHSSLPWLVVLATFLPAVSTTVRADQGIGFAWNTNAAQESVYKIDLSTGTAAIIGTIPDLAIVAVGSHNVDYPTGVGLFAGSKGQSSADTIFTVIPASRAVFSFSLTGFTADSSVQRVLLRSFDGTTFAVTTDRIGVPQVGKVTFNLLSATATITNIGTLPVSSYDLDGLRIGDDGKIYILTPGAPDAVAVFDTLSGAAGATGALPDTGHQGLFVCDQESSAPRLFSFLTTRVPSVSTNLVEISSIGTETTKLSNLSVQAVAGSYTCTQNVLRYLGASDSRTSPTSQLFSFDVTSSATGFTAITLGQSDLKYVGVTKAAVAASKRVSTRATTFSLIGAAATKKCVAQAGTKKLPKGKALTFRAMAKGLSKVRRSKGKCSVR